MALPLWRIMNRRAGFTLLEVIVSLSIAGIVGMFLAGFLKPGLDLYRNSHDDTYGKYLCQKAWEYLERELRFASRFAESEEDGQNCLLWYEREWNDNGWAGSDQAELVEVRKGTMDPGWLMDQEFFQNLPEEKICIYLEFFNIKDFQADVRILAVRVAEEEKEGEKLSLPDPENVLYSQEISIISMYLPNENTS